MTNLISKYFKKILLINAILTTYNTLPSDVNTREIEIYLNEYYEPWIYEVGDCNLQTIKKYLVNKFNENKVNRISKNDITIDNIEFARALDNNDKIIGIEGDIVPEDVTKIHFLTKSAIEAVKNLNIDEVYINASKLDEIDPKGFTEEFQNRINNNNGDIIKQGRGAITDFIYQQIKETDAFKNLYKENSHDSKYNYMYNQGTIYFQHDGAKHGNDGYIFEYVEDYNNSTDPGKKCVFFLGCRYNVHYNVKYIPPAGIELRTYHKNKDKYQFNNDGFGDATSFPAVIKIEFENKDQYDSRTADNVKEKIKGAIIGIYNEYEDLPYNFNNLEQRIYEKEKEYQIKVNRGDNIIIPEGKNWNTLEPGDTIEVELSEKSELVKSKIAKIKFNPPAGHQLKNELYNKEIPVVLTKGDFGKDCLKEELSKMELDIDGRKIKLTKDIINSITGNFDNTDEGVIKGCNAQIPIEAGDFIATEQEIKQREQEKREQDKNKKPQSPGVSEGTARCCACCGKCCKGECCKVGCCKENNSGG